MPPEPGRLATASVTASAAQMARFVQFQLGDGTWDGTSLLSAAGMAQMHAGAAQGDGFTYGLGWRNVDVAGVRTVQHGGVLPNYRGKMILLPEQDMAVVVLTNASSALPLPITPTSHRLANDIALYIAGGPLGVPNLGYRIWLIVFWGGLGLILLHQIVTLARIMRKRDPAHAPLRSAAADIAMVLAIIFVLPWAIDLSLRGIVIQTPDLALWLAVMSALALCAAVLRIVRSIR
jgi:CubicO group peptidase (beta-lactamase class C family)